jgi:putative transcriptional regulator
VAGAEEEPPGWRPLFVSADPEGRGPLRIGLLHLDTPIEIVTGAYRDLRIFAGYSGWAAGQLQAEIATGMWHVLEAAYTDIFGAEPLDLWRQVLRRQQSALALFSTWVEDPDLN